MRWAAPDSKVGGVAMSAAEVLECDRREDRDDSQRAHAGAPHAAARHATERIVQPAPPQSQPDRLQVARYCRMPHVARCAYVCMLHAVCMLSRFARARISCILETRTPTCARTRSRHAQRHDALRWRPCGTFSVPQQRSSAQVTRSAPTLSRLVSGIASSARPAD